VILRAVERGLLDRFQRTELYGWWRRLALPQVDADKRGPYRFKHSPPPKEQLTEDEQKNLFEKLLTREQQRAWKEDDSMNVELSGRLIELKGAEVLAKDNVEYLKYKAAKVLDPILLELDMYMYHLRVMNDVQNKRRVKNCFFIIGQQVMRQSIKYFALYRGLSSNRTTSIIA